MNFEFRTAVPKDANQCIVMRGKTRENAYSIDALAAIGITLQTWQNGIENGGSPGFVCLNNEEIVGMCFYDNESGEILVVAVHPGFESQGIGKILLKMALNELKEKKYTKSFLGCNPRSESRSYGFYRHMGWSPTGDFDNNGDEILEISL
jgi:ribosomal protein S18 acetylase RimI-like enzyme